MDGIWGVLFSLGLISAILLLIGRTSTSLMRGLAVLIVGVVVSAHMWLREPSNVLVGALGERDCLISLETGVWKDYKNLREAEAIINDVRKDVWFFHQLGDEAGYLKSQKKFEGLNEEIKRLESIVDKNSVEFKIIGRKGSKVIVNSSDNGLVHLKGIVPYFRGKIVNRIRCKRVIE